MKIYINKKEVVLPSDFSMSYDIENRFFTQSTEGWSLDFDLPLRGCPRNLAIFGAVNRKDVKLNTLSWSCMISHGSFIKKGLAIPISVNEKSISLQFLDGRSEINYKSPLETYLIRNINLPYTLSIATSAAARKAACLNNAQKDADDNYWELCLPWMNNHSGNLQNAMDVTTQVTDPDTGYYYYDFNSNVTEVSCQIYLIELTRRILTSTELGYTVDLTEWSNSVWKYLLVWNAVPYTWGERNFNIALPKWTAMELLREIETLTGLDFDINEREKTIVARFAPTVVANSGIVKLDKVEESFEIEFGDESEVEFVGTNELKYADRDDNEWKWESCTSAIKRMEEIGILDNTPYAMSSIDFNGVRKSSVSSLNSQIYFCEEKNKYIKQRLLLVHGTEAPFDYGVGACFLNEFGSTTDDEEASVKEIRIVPARITETVTWIIINYGGWDNINLDPGEYDNAWVSEPTTIDEANAYKDVVERNIEEVDTVEYYDKLYVTFWEKRMGFRGQWGTMLSQNNGQVGVRDRLRYGANGRRAMCQSGGYQWNNYLWDENMSLSLDRRTNSNWYLSKIDKTRKYTFKWISKTLPDVKSVFLVNGRRFYCAVIKTIWTINGMSEELSGDFYEIL